MTDIVIIDVERFLECRNNIDEELVRTKYDSIYIKYSCFSAPCFAPTTTHSFVHKKQHNTHLAKRHASKDDDRHFFQVKKKDLNRTITGILNVINQTNYNKMLNKIRLLKSDLNIASIVSDTLKMCASQIFYLSIYMKLLKDVHTYCAESEKLIFIKAIDEYIIKYTGDMDWLKDYSSENVSDYDGFCDHQKQKSCINAQNMILIEIVQLFDVYFDIDKYACDLMNSLESSLSQQEDDKSIIIAQMIIYIAKKIKMQSISWDIVKLAKFSDSKKVQFVIEELISIVDHNNEA